MELVGNWQVVLKFGDDVVGLSPSGISEFTIIQDMNRLVPSFRIALKDPIGGFTHIIPFDRGMSRVSISLGRADAVKQPPSNSFDFIVYRRHPDNIQGTQSYYDIMGLLTAGKAFSPEYCRAWNDPVSTILATIAAELETDLTEISPALTTKKNIVQPRWTNVQLLNYLKENLADDSGNAAFVSFIKKKEGKSTFVFKTRFELMQNAPEYSFIVDQDAVEDYKPILDYTIYDNYKVLGIFGSKKQGYSYFDYYNDAYVEGEEQAVDSFSLSDYFLIDKGDSEDSHMISNTGRSNEFTLDFEGKVKSNYHNRLANLVNMWITTWGLPNIVPGTVVKVLFPQGLVTTPEYMFSYQYSGYWLVERVVHSFVETFRTRLLLTRQGMDTDKDTSLLAATRKKRR